MEGRLKLDPNLNPRCNLVGNLFDPRSSAVFSVANFYCSAFATWKLERMEEWMLRDIVYVYFYIHHTRDIQIPREVRCFRFISGVQICFQQVFGCLGILIYTSINAIKKKHVQKRQVNLHKQQNKHICKYIHIIYVYIKHIHIFCY